MEDEKKTVWKMFECSHGNRWTSTMEDCHLLPCNFSGCTCKGEVKLYGYTNDRETAGNWFRRMKDNPFDRSDVAEWLESLPGISEVQPLGLDVQDEHFEGASYLQEGEYTAGMMAVQRGEHKEGEKYYDRRYYFVGNIPKCRKKWVALCFTHEEKVIYLAGHYGQQKITDHHPFGAMFILSIWDEATLGAIDKYETVKYHRIPIQFS